MRSCRGSWEPTPTPHVWAGVRRCCEEAERGCRKTWCCYQPDAVAGQRGNTSGVALRMPAHQCQNESSSLPEGESPARTRPSCGVQDLAGGDSGLQAPLPCFSWVGGLKTRSSNGVPQNGLLGESEGWSRFCGTSKRHCQAIPSRISWGPSRDQVQGELFG